MPSPTDSDLRLQFAHDPHLAWRRFIDEFTPVMLALIERTGVRDRDEVMDIYIRACDRLVADDFARLRRHDPARGPVRAWLATVVRHVAVDWVRSRVGRRRLFGAVRELSAFDQRVFELYYWDDRMPAEIAERLAERGALPDVAAVLDALARIESVLTARHRADLLSMAARQRHAASLDADPAAGVIPDDRPDPEVTAAATEYRRHLEAGLARLPAEDAAIVRLKFVHGLSLSEVQRALHLPTLTEARVAAILKTLRALMA